MVVLVYLCIGRCVDIGVTLEQLHEELPPFSEAYYGLRAAFVLENPHDWAREGDLLTALRERRAHHVTRVGLEREIQRHGMAMHRETV